MKRAIIYAVLLAMFASHATAEPEWNGGPLGKVLIDSDTNFSGMTLQLISIDWPARYDSIELEIVRMRPNASGTLSIEPMDGGVAVSTNLHNSTTELLDNVSAPTTDTTWTFPDSTNTAVAQVCGALRIWNVEGALQGTGHFTHQTTTGPTDGGFTMYIRRHAVPATSWDGFEITHSGGTFAGSFRLWGLPNT